MTQQRKLMLGQLGALFGVTAGVVWLSDTFNWFPGLAAWIQAGERRGVELAVGSGCLGLGLALLTVFRWRESDADQANRGRSVADFPDRDAGSNGCGAERSGSTIASTPAVADQGVACDITWHQQLRDARERHQRRVALLGDISRRLAMSETPRQLLEGIFADVAREVGVDIFANYMVKPDGSGLLLESSGGLDETQQKDFAELQFGVSLCGLVAQKRERLVFADLPAVQLPQAAGIIALGVRAYAGHPLIAGDRLIGTISFGSRRHERFEEEDVAMMKAVADQLAAALERSRLRAAVAEREEQFRTLVALSPDAICIHQNGRVVYMNQQGLRLWRARTEADVIGVDPMQLIHPDSRDLVRARIRQALEQRIHQPLQEVKILTVDGTALDAETTAAVFEFQGAPAVQVLVRDVTSRKQAEAAIRLSEEKFSQAFDHNAAAIALTRLEDGTVLAVNDTWVRLCGYTREEMVGRSARSMWPDEAAVARFIAELRARGELRGWEQEFRRKSGEIFTVELWTKRLEIGGEQLILSTLVDISARRRAEEALRAHKEILEETGRIAKVGGWSFDAITGEGYWTDEVARIHDLDPAEATSRDIGLSFYTNESRPRIEAAMKAAVEQGQPYDLELEIRTAKGVRKWVYTIGHPVVENGRVVRVHGSFQDVTAYKKLEEQFLRAQRLEAVGTLSSGIAHDLNNILAPLMMITPMLRSKLTEPRDGEMIDIVEQAARRGANIIRQLLTFSRGVEGERGPVQLQYLIREMVALMRETFPRDVVIANQADPSLWLVVGDATRLHQVLMNLCVNARDAMPAGGTLSLAAQNVVLSAEEAALHAGAKPGPHVCLTVSDTGQGIPQENLDRIFEPFFTTKEVGKGTGLGLSTALGIVKSHGGFVTVASERDRGTTFRIYLPADTTGVEIGATVAVPPPQGQGECVLVVDDESPIRATIRALLESAGYRVLVAADGKEAVELFAQNARLVHLVLSDLMMPRMDGLALVRKLRTMAPTLKVVMMTGLQDAAKRQALSALGVTELVAKPFTYAELLSALQRELQRAGV